MQNSEKELQLALSEQKRSNDEIKRELKDHEDLLMASNQTQQENQRLSLDVSRLRESESFLSGRVEELEQESSGLRMALTNNEKKIWERERRWQDKLDSLEEELATSLTSVEDTKKEHSLKIEVEGLKGQTNELQKSLKEKTREAEKADAAFRSEVSLTSKSTVTSEAADDGQNQRPRHKSSSLVRYRSLRDHNGRYYLVVKIH